VKVLSLLMLRVALISGIAGALFLGGCGGPKLEGKWIASDTARETITFRGNKFTLEGSLPNGITLTIGGTYTYDKDKLTLMSQSVSMKASHPAEQKMIDKNLAANQQRLLSAFDSKNPRQVTWWKNDEVHFKTSDGKDTMYDRVQN